MSEAQPTTTDRQTAHDLTAFQQHILTVLSEKPRYGLAIKRELESYYGTEASVFS